MGDEPRVNYLSCHPLAGTDAQRGVEGLKALSADQRRRMELDLKVAQVDPEVRRRIVRNAVGDWAGIIIVCGLMLPWLSGDINFGDRANAAIASVLILGFVWWAWRASRRRKAR